MTARVQLRLYVHPAEAEVVIHVKRLDGSYRTLTATIDTGAEVSLFPMDILAELDHRVSQRGAVHVEQAGIAQQSFKGTEAYIRLFLEDYTGSRTHEFEAPVWFANTNAILLGFEGILDQAILHIDMKQRFGWIEI
jgi:hypothetical protein